MSKAVLMSIKPNFCELIASGKKTIEVRKTRPKLQPPFKCYIYETSQKYKKGTGIYLYGVELKGTAQGQGKVIGEFVCDNVSPILGKYNDKWALDKACLTVEEAGNYLGRIDGPMCYTIYGTKNGYAWHISDLVVYDTPKELGMFYRYIKLKDYHFCTGCPYRETPKFTFPCNECKHEAWAKKYLTKPPKSWCYVEEV